MVYLKVKENTLQAKMFLQFIKTMPFIEFIREDVPNEITKKAMKEAENGKVYKAKNATELLQKLKA